MDFSVKYNKRKSFLRFDYISGNWVDVKLVPGLSVMT